MRMSEKNLDDLLDRINQNTSVLFLGQDYFTCDADFYNRVIKELKITEQSKTFNDIWMSCMDNVNELGNVIRRAAGKTEYQPWFRTVLSMGWNVALTSSVNLEWMKQSVGNDFAGEIHDATDFTGIRNMNFYKNFNKNQLKLISLLGNEDSIPNERELRKRMNNQAFLGKVYADVLELYGILVVDGVSAGDWFSIDKFLGNIDNVPSGCIYFFGMTEEKLQNISDYEWGDWEEYINNGQIILEERTLREIIEERDMIEDLNEPETDLYGENLVRVSLREGDCIWLPRNGITQLRNLGITVMRDEILTPLVANDNLEKYFAEFLQQRDRKSWSFFDVIYKKERYSFHIPRTQEGLLINKVETQINNTSNNRSIILLRGSSNSGKTTTLSWLAWKLAKEGIKAGKKDKGKYLIYYISGNPANYDEKWQEILIDFIKNSVNRKLTVNKNRIVKNIIIWDDYNSQDKKGDYLKLHSILNECNGILIGSAYSVENSDGQKNESQDILQGVNFETITLTSDLDKNAKSKLQMLLSKINNEWKEQLDGDYMFEVLMDFAKFNYSEEWRSVRELLKARLSAESAISENISNKKFELFKNKNPDSFRDVGDVIRSMGIGSIWQVKYEELSKEQKKKNEPLINSIKQMNRILAVAGQFRNNPSLPLSVVLHAISDGKQYVGEYNKLNSILRSDSMVKYDNNARTGIPLISFRHPSEASAYLDNEFSEQERKEKEIEILINIINACRWDVVDEAYAVATLIRAFGTNSYGKYKEEIKQRGQYDCYKEYWEEIINALMNNYGACDNPEAMLIVGHFTRDSIEKKVIVYDDNTIMEKLKDVCVKMGNTIGDAIDDTISGRTLVPYSSKSRLYGEMCRNTIERMQRAENNQNCDFSAEFKNYFHKGIEAGKKAKNSSKSISLIQFLDMWLIYYEYNKDKALIPDTLDYIDQLLYNEWSIIPDEEDYSNVLRKVNEFYVDIHSDMKNIEDKFRTSNNDSYVFFKAKMELVEVLNKYCSELDTISKDGDGRRISNRIFFLNEYAADDFYSSYSKELNNVFLRIKCDLADAASKIIKIFDDAYETNIDRMSYRCLNLLLKAKWMNYTGNLMMEKGQYPKLDASRWKEIDNICSACIQKAENNDPPRAVKFMHNNYIWAFTEDKPDYRRLSYENPDRVICLCDENGKPRCFGVTIKKTDNKRKLNAKIDKEIIDGVSSTEGTIVSSKREAYVPQNINNYTDLSNGKLNVSYKYEIWFNIGGAQIQDWCPEGNEEE